MWLRRWYQHKKAFRQSLRNSTLHRIFGDRLFHRHLWRTDRTAMAGGLALGLFVAFTPTIPFQMLLAGVGALFLKVNLPIAVLAVWVSNPVTAIPIFMSAWSLGRTILGPESPLEDVIAIFTPPGRPGKILLDSAYLWGGSLIYATLAALTGYLAARAASLAITRMVLARKIGFRPNPPMTLLLKSLFLIALISTGFALQYYGIIDTTSMLESLREDGNRWLPFATLAVMIPLYTFALPAAPLMALCGVFFHPILATTIVFAGGTIGSLFAYGISHQLAASGRQQRQTKAKLTQRMRESTTFASLFALRICPGVPHAAINYTAGALHIPLTPFVTSTAVGFLAKGIVYTSAVYRATHIDSNTEIWSFTVLWPLIALLAMALAGIWIERHLTQRKNATQPEDERPKAKDRRS